MAAGPRDGCAILLCTLLWALGTGCDEDGDNESKASSVPATQPERDPGSSATEAETSQSGSQEEATGDGTTGGGTTEDGTTEGDSSASDADPLADLAGLGSDGSGASGATQPAEDAAVPERGCTVRSAAQRIWAHEGPSTVVRTDGAWAVAGYGAPDGDALFVVRVLPDGKTMPITRWKPGAPASEREAAPAMAHADGKLTVAGTDGEGGVHVGVMRVHRPTAGVQWKRVGGGADPRFPPAVALLEEHRVVAWAQAKNEGMRVRLVRLKLDGSLASRHDVTLESMGATAPVFVAGAGEPILLFLDARKGVSPLLRLALREDGTPTEAEVVRPVRNAYEPPDLAAAAAEPARIGYTAVGSAATTAVGLLPLDGSGASPVALVPGEGYGRLGVAGASLGGAALFAASAPRGQDPESDREIHVRRVDGEGPGPATVLRGPGGRAREPSLATGAGGKAAVTFEADGGIYLVRLECTP